MSNDRESRRPIIGNGESYVTKANPPKHQPPPPPPRTYDEARALVKKELTRSLDQVQSMPETARYRDSFFLCMRLHPDSMAKSYDPEVLFSKVPNLHNVGSRNYTADTKSVASTSRIEKIRERGDSTVDGRLVFVRGRSQDFTSLMTLLDRAETTLPKKFCEEIRRIERFDLLSAGEKLLGFESPTWSHGRVELVFHPTNGAEASEFIKKLVEKSGFTDRSVRTVRYADGPIFVSCHIARGILESLGGINPLRTAHPMEMRALEELRGAPSFPSPQPSSSKTRSKIRLGVFDGGIDVEHPMFRGHVEQDEEVSIKTKPSPRFVDHGTAVVGAALYGPLNDYNVKDPLPPPRVSVVSVRVLPTSDPTDEDLYECIDVIERAVPAHKDVTTWNLSFGPRGPILDDTVSRFTYVLDELANRHNVTFCVAVGNSGEYEGEAGRVQSPSDLANGLGIGAFSRTPSGPAHAKYSCHGPGRECAKIKPDVAAFGGCDSVPIHLVSTSSGKKLLSYGTSFASPIAAALAAQLSSTADGGTALLARALLVHTAVHPSGTPDELLGHGAVVDDVENVLTCTRNDVTILYQGELPSTKYAKLPILLPPGLVTDGKIEICWTVACLPEVNPSHPSDYTTIGIEDTFYPNSLKFTFSKKQPSGKPLTKQLHLHQQADEVAALLDEGWTQGSQCSESGNNYRPEADRRQLEYKWEPVVRRLVRKQNYTVHEPYLILHPIPRNGGDGRITYAAIVTVRALKFDGDLYSAIRTRFPNLVPIRIRSEAELRVRI